MGDLETLQAAVAANPADLAAKIALAEALAAQAQYEQALETALAVVQSGKKEFVEPARKLMVDIFRLLARRLRVDHRRIAAGSRRLCIKQPKVLRRNVYHKVTTSTKKPIKSSFFVFFVSAM